MIPSAAFIRASRRYAKTHPDSLASLRETLSLLESDALDPRLRTHKLEGDLKGSWACSAGRDLRIVFEFIQHSGAEAILLLSLGTHDEVY
jgi:mRNA interferase YafQ